MTRPTLVLRPEPGAAQTAAALASRGLEALCWPLFNLSPCAWDAEGAEAAGALLLTSATAVRLAGAGLERCRHLPVIAVGPKTAAAAHDKGLTVALTGAADAAALVPMIAASPYKSLLHLAGESAPPFPPVPQPVIRRIVYRAEACTPDAALSALLDRHPVLLLHSPDAARAMRFALTDLGHDPRNFSLVAISSNTAHAAGDGWAQVAIAREPRDEAMIDLADRLCRAPIREQE